jgi:hypothetical protein
MLVVKVSVTFTRIRLILIGCPELLEQPSFGKIVMDEGGLDISHICCWTSSGLCGCWADSFPYLWHDFHSGQRIESTALKNI